MLWERQLLHNEPQTERDEAKCCNLKLQKGAGLQYQIFIHTKLNRLYSSEFFNFSVNYCAKKKRVLTFLSSRHLNVDWVGH